MRRWGHTSHTVTHVHTHHPLTGAGPAEIGHAIYGLSHVEQVIHTATRSLLEEPRAELMTLRTLKVAGAGAAGWRHCLLAPR